MRVNALIILLNILLNIFRQNVFKSSNKDIFCRFYFYPRLSLMRTCLISRFIY